MIYLNYQLQQLLRLVQTPAGVIAVIFVLLLPVAAVAFERARWVILAVAIYVSSLGRPLDKVNFPHLIPVLAPINAISRPLISFLLIVLLLPTIWTGAASWRQRLWLGGTLAFFIFELALSARDIFGGTLDRGILGFFDFTLMFLVMVVGVSRWIQSVEDANAAIKCMFVAGVLFVLGTVGQIASGGGYVLVSRLTATAENSNFAGLAIVSALAPALYLLMCKGQLKAWKALAGMTTGLLLVMIVWTGSRNAALMSAIIMFFMFRRRLRSFVVVGAVLALFVFAGVAVYGSKIELAGRVLSTSDTRSQVWLNLIHGFLSNPLFGVGTGLASENSYLLSACRAGLMAFLPLAVSIFMIGGAIYRLQSRRAILGDDQLLLDMATGATIATLTGAIFDGYLTANFSVILLTLFIHLAILAFIRDGISVTVPQLTTHDDDVVDPMNHAVALS